MRNTGWIYSVAAITLLMSSPAFAQWMLAPKPAPAPLIGAGPVAGLVIGGIVLARWLLNRR
jgi:hypothetical protein